MMTMRSKLDGTAAAASRGSGIGRRLTAGLATLVLALATGVPLHSAQNLLPHPGPQTTPYLGV